MAVTENGGAGQTRWPDGRRVTVALHSALQILLAVTGARLVVGPLIGADRVGALSPPVLAALGSAFIATLALWALRPHPRRALRAQILVAFGLILFASLYRLRPDQWESADMANGDRYFYIPRVLLVWLLVWEFDAAPRAVAFAARAVCLTAVLVQIPRHTLPTPPDYHWAEQCEPIRRGVPANINTLPEGWTIEYLGRPQKPPDPR